MWLSPPQHHRAGSPTSGTPPSQPPEDGLSGLPHGHLARRVTSCRRAGSSWRGRTPAPGCPSHAVAGAGRQAQAGGSRAELWAVPPPQRLEMKTGSHFAEEETGPAWGSQSPAGGPCEDRARRLLRRSPRWCRSEGRQPCARWATSKERGLFFPRLIPGRGGNGRPWPGEPSA